jgi:hypothetical protein
MRKKPFLAFNLDDLRIPRKGRPLVSMIIVSAETLGKAKDFLAEHYPESTWAVVPKRELDKGIVAGKTKEKV